MAERTCKAPKVFASQREPFYVVKTLYSLALDHGLIYIYTHTRVYHLTKYKDVYYYFFKKRGKKAPWTHL